MSRWIKRHGLFYFGREKIILTVFYLLHLAKDLNPFESQRAIHGIAGESLSTIKVEGTQERGGDTMFERILVPLDGSGSAEHVLPYAEAIAAKFKAEMILASVSEFGSEERDHLYESYLDRMVQQVQAQLQEWGGEEGVQVKGEVLFGKPASEILRYADEKNVSLITMASRGRSSRGPWFLGNIAAKVLRATSKPVLLVRAKAGEDRLREKRLVRKILVPLDGSKLGELALPHAEALVQALDSELILFHAFTLITMEAGYRYAEIVPDKLKETEEYAKKSILAYLDGLGKSFQEKGIRVAKVLRFGPAPDQILEYAEENGIDIIAMSTHGRSGIGRWVFGSVTDKVLHAGNTAVLTVRATRG